MNTMCIENSEELFFNADTRRLHTDSRRFIVEISAKICVPIRENLRLRKIFQRPIIKILLILSFVFTLNLYADEETPESTLKALIEEAILKNPQLVSARRRYEAEAARIPQKTALEDPWIGIEYEQIPRKTTDLDKAPMRMYSISQEIPFPTKIITRTKAQKSSAEAYYQRYKEKERGVISKVKSVFSELFLIYKAIDINQENKALLEQLANTAATRFSLGKASQQDALKAQVEIARIDNELIMLEQKRQVAIARLNILLNRHPQQELERPDIKEIVQRLSPIDEYFELAKEKRPELSAFRSEIRVAKSMYSLAKQDYLPDFMVEAQQREENSELGGWDLMVKARVPLWFMQKQNFQVKQMREELKMAEAEYKDMENMTLLEVKEAHSMMEALIKLAELYKTSFLPQAEQTFKASLTGYETGQVDFLNLLDSQRMVLEFKLDYYDVLVNLEIAKADLERAVGADLF